MTLVAAVPVHRALLLSAADKAEIVVAVHVLMYAGAIAVGTLAVLKILRLPAWSLLDTGDAPTASRKGLLQRWFRYLLPLLLKLLALGLAMEMTLNWLQAQF
jgi:hypothetical protein